MNDVRWMREALEEASAAGRRGEVPVGAVVVVRGAVVARGRNRREATSNPLHHAEIVALQAAAAAQGTWRLDGATMYVTLEPCSMCAGAMIQARLARVVYAAPDPKAGACGSVLNLADYPGLPHQVAVRGGVLAEEASALLQAFFHARRGPGGQQSSVRRGGRAGR